MIRDTIDPKQRQEHRVCSRSLLTNRIRPCDQTDFKRGWLPLLLFVYLGGPSRSLQNQATTCFDRPSNTQLVWRACHFSKILPHPLNEFKWWLSFPLKLDFPPDSVSYLYPAFLRKSLSKKTLQKIPGCPSAHHLWWRTSAEAINEMVARPGHGSGRPTTQCNREWTIVVMTHDLKTQ